MNKVIIIGSGGSGKSTLARELGDKLTLNVYHLDSLFWKPNWVGVHQDEQKKIQKELVKNDEWIIDGNYGRTLDIRLNAADTIIFLDINRTICVYRVFKRMLQYRNKVRPDMGADCKERLDLGFLEWVWDYPMTKKPGILKKLEQIPKEKQIIILSTPKQIKTFLQDV